MYVRYTQTRDGRSSQEAGAVEFADRARGIRKLEWLGSEDYYMTESSMELDLSQLKRTAHMRMVDW